jgi:hypothetical protein
MIPIILYIWYKISAPNSELPKMTNEEIKTYFIKNNKEFKDIVNICDKYPKIGFVDTEDIDILKEYYNEKLPNDTLKKMKQIQNIIKKINIYSLQCASGITNKDNQLAGVSFVLYSFGFTFGGESQSINFETKAFRDLFNHKKRIKIDNEEIYPLNEEGWSIVYIKN